MLDSRSTCCPGAFRPSPARRVRRDAEEAKKEAYEESQDQARLLEDKGWPADRSAVALARTRPDGLFIGVLEQRLVIGGHWLYRQRMYKRMENHGWIG